MLANASLFRFAAGGMIALGIICILLSLREREGALLPGGVLSLALGIYLAIRLADLHPTAVHFEPHDRNPPAPVIRGGRLPGGGR